ncbi:nitrogenase component 1 [Pectinatus frisingensis]
MRTLKHLLSEMEVDANIIFDIEKFDAPLMPDGNHTAHGSTTIEDLENTGSAIGTIALNRYESGRAAAYLEKTFGIPTIIGPSPIGIRNTDTFLQNVKTLTGKSIPQSLVRERGIAIDAITDVAHMFLADKRVAIYGNPDLVIGLTEFCLDMEMKPVLLLLGDDNTNYAADKRIKALQENINYDMEIITNADLWNLGDLLQNKGLKLDLILGHSKGRFIAMDNKIPLVRVGFPVFDRAGYYRDPTIGYEGAMLLAEKIANVWFTDMEYTKNKEWLLNMW